MMLYWSLAQPRPTPNNQVYCNLESNAAWCFKLNARRNFLTPDTAICTRPTLIWKQHPTKNQLYGHLPPMSKTIQKRKTRHVGHCCRSQIELINKQRSLMDPFTRTCKCWTTISNLFICTDTECNREDLSEAMDDWERNGKRDSEKSMPAARHNDNDL